MGLYRYAQMVIKTDPCAFSEMKIYPGRGTKFVSKDGKTHLFISSKTRSLFHQRIKPVKLTWTQASRRFNKKTKVVDIQKKRAETTEVRDSNLEASKKELKARNVKKMQEKNKVKKAAPKQALAQKAVNTAPKKA